MQLKSASSEQFWRICRNAHESRLSSDQGMASIYSFYNSWKACQILHFIGAVGEQQFVACSVRYWSGRPFPLRAQSNKKNTTWHRRFERKRDLRERLLPVPQRPINLFSRTTQVKQLSDNCCPNNAKFKCCNTWKQCRYHSSWFSFSMTPVISRGVVYEKLPQAPRRCTDMLVEIDYIHQCFLPNE